MSTPEVPSPVVRAARELAASLAQCSLEPVMREALERLASTSTSSARLVAAASQQQSIRPQWLSERVAAVLEPGRTARQEAIQRLMDQIGRSWAERIQAAAVSQVRIDTPGLDRVLADWQAWQQLGEDDREAAVAVLEESYEQATADPAADAPAEMVTQLEETVREFESSQAGLIPPRMQRGLFVYFVGLIVIVLLMQASFTSDTADEVLGKGAELAPYAGLAMLAAGSAWDRYARRPDEDAGDEEREDEGPER